MNKYFISFYAEFRICPISTIILFNGLIDSSKQLEILNKDVENIWFGDGREIVITNFILIDKNIESKSTKTKIV